jgi:hypothetical protein
MWNQTKIFKPGSWARSSSTLEQLETLHLPPARIVLAPDQVHFACFFLQNGARVSPIPNHPNQEKRILIFSILKTTHFFISSSSKKPQRSQLS